MESGARKGSVIDIVLGILTQPWERKGETEEMMHCDIESTNGRT